MNAKSNESIKIAYRPNLRQFFYLHFDFMLSLRIDDIEGVSDQNSK